MANDGKTAIAIYLSALRNDKPFDIITMDLHIIKGMEGVDTAREILALNSNTKIILASGDPGYPVMQNFADYGFSASVSKPFDFTDFKKAYLNRLKNYHIFFLNSSPSMA